MFPHLPAPIKLFDNYIILNFRHYNRLLLVYAFKISILICQNVGTLAADILYYNFSHCVTGRNNVYLSYYKYETNIFLSRSR
jgi:hypothetical protein